MKRSTGILCVVALVACGGNNSEAKAPSAGDGAVSATSSESSAASAPPVASDDLSELELKRYIDDVKKLLPAQKTRFKETCGSDVDLVIDWASFGKSRVAYGYLLSNVGPARLVDGFAGVCGDKTGKDAVSAKVKVLKAVNVHDKDRMKSTLSGGTFTIFMSWSTGNLLTDSDIGASLTKAL